MDHTKMIAQLEHVISIYEGDISKLQSENKRQAERIAQLVEALEWYADEDNYMAGWTDGGIATAYINHMGDKAKAALDAAKG